MVSRRPDARVAGILCSRRWLPPLSPIQFTYGDYATWQQEREASKAARSQLRYWVDSLRDAPPFIDLPADHVRPASFTFDGAVHSTLIDEPLTAELRQLSRKRGATLFMTCLSAFFVLLHRMTRQSDLVIGTPVAGRGRLETEQLIGFFVNLLPLRAQIRESSRSRTCSRPSANACWDVAAPGNTVRSDCRSRLPQSGSEPSSVVRYPVQLSLTSHPPSPGILVCGRSLKKFRWHFAL